MATTIRLNKQTKAIKVVNRKENIRLTHTKGENIKLQHTGKTGPASTIPGPKGEGIPTGGIDGQVLHKASNSDYDFEWMTPSFEDKNYEQNFTVSNDVLVTHSLAKYPAVTVIDSAGDEIEGGVEHLDTNSLRLVFSAPFSGRVICN